MSQCTSLGRIRTRMSDLTTSLAHLRPFFLRLLQLLIASQRRLSFLALGASMAESAQRGGKLNVFISYSRDDLVSRTRSMRLWKHSALV